MLAVSNMPAITALQQIGRSEFFRELYREVLVPNAVRQGLNEVHPVLPPSLSETLHLITLLGKGGQVF